MSADVYISYHAGSSGQIATTLCNALEAAGIKCFYAPRDVSINNITANYTAGIIQAIENCKVFLILLNKKASESPHVLNELDIAYQRCRTKNDLIILPFRLSPEPLSPSANYYLAPYHHIDGYTPPLEKRYRELVTELKLLLAPPETENEIQKPLLPYKGEKPYIFVSYSHRNTEEALQLIKNLQEHRYRVWYDEGIDPGTEWDENIATHVENCSFFISLLSHDYLESSNCKDELNFARELEKQRLLIYLEDLQLPAGMRMRLGRLQAIHKYKYDDEEYFLEKLYSSVGIQDCRD